MLKNRIEIMSREAIENLIADGFPNNVAVISFFDPKSKRTPKEYAHVDYAGVCDRVFPVAIHDIDIEILPDYGLNPDTYFPEAAALARYIIESVSSGYDIICQCEYGQSRSAACAAAIKEFGYKDSFSHVSTGGGASLEMIENDGHLPGVDILK